MSDRTPSDVTELVAVYFGLDDDRGDVVLSIREDEELPETEIRMSRAGAEQLAVRLRAFLDSPRDGAPPRHATDECGDCPSWCEACRLERQQRAKDRR